MTRFARAKGSKASNERKEEEATPWHVMRLQSSVNNNNKTELSNNDFIDFKHFLNTNRSANIEEIWCDFDDLDKNNQHSSIKKNLVKKTEDSKLYDSNKRRIIDKDTEYKIEERVLKPKSKVKANKSTLKSGLFTTTSNDVYNYEATKTKVLISNKMTKCNLSALTNTNNKGSGNGNRGEVDNLISKKFPTKNEISLECGIKKCTKGKMLKNEVSFNKVSYEVMHTREHFETSLSSTSTKNEIKSLKKIKTIQTNKNGCTNTTTNNSNGLHTIFVNGREIQLVQYEGYFIKKGDAVRLKYLRKQLKTKGIEKEQINTIMKLERRKAEKALAREKRNVCFHCRKYGHNFGDCPLIKGSEMSKSGLCFKCGSTEHSYYQCKVLKNEDFRHATCFICKEQGHISRQCSLNPQGQYPKGGCCHLCGEVTHLRKNCPKAIDEKLGNSLTVDKFNNIGIEDLSEIHDQKNTLPTKKILTF